MRRQEEMDSPAITKNDVVTASGPGIAGFSVNGKWKNPLIRSPKEASMIRRIQGEGDKSFVIYPFRKRRWCSGCDVCTLYRCSWAHEFESGSYSLYIFFCNLRMSSDPVVVFLP